MNIYKTILVCFFVTAVSFAQKSPRQQAEGKIDQISVAIDYGAPSVRGRVIWGDLVKYNDVWRAGANENTTISFDKEVSIAGNKLAAGKYGFFMIPNEKGNWTAIFSTKNDAWGSSSYNEKEDALRVEITPEFVSDVQEQLLYTVAKNSINFSWEKARIAIPVK
ncbi:MAG: DUF2911 domain-containing protein [Flavobacteriaceae bacterium]|nr:DUF2911 domain-containing protein [Flavobacteriaceae bacterium]